MNRDNEDMKNKTAKWALPTRGLLYIHIIWELIMTIQLHLATFHIFLIALAASSFMRDGSDKMLVVVLR